jgi:hypothetical protein
MNEEIIGGVSPLKKRRTGGVSGKKTTRGGTEAGAATSRKGNWLGGRGGYAKSRGIEGGGGQNVGGYNLHTRFVPRKSATAAQIGSGKSKPYSYDKDGELVVNPDFLTGSEYKKDDDIVTTKMVRTDKDGKVVKPEDNACSDEYIAKHGDAECIEYKKYRKENPVDRSKRTQVEVEIREDGQKWQQDYKIVDGKKIITKPWFKI